MKNVTQKNSDHLAVIDGGLVTPTDLPPINTVRWVPSRKAQVVAAVHAGVLSITAACHRYRLSPEEFLEWERHYKAGTLGKPRASKRSALH